METIKGIFSPVVDATVRAFMDRASEEQSSMLYYQDLGLNEYQPDVPDEVLNDISGFGRAALSSEGQEFGMVTRVKGLTGSPFKTVSDLGKALNKWVTLSKQAIAVQLQRLSEMAMQNA